MLDPAESEKAPASHGGSHFEDHSPTANSNEEFAPAQVFDGTPTYADSAQNLLANGYFPIPISPGSKAPIGLTTWTTDGPDIIPAWVRSRGGHGVGVRSGNGLLVVDVDTTNPDLTSQVLGLVCGGLFGLSPLRIGRKGGGVLFRCPEIAGGETWEHQADQAQMVELRGTGQQLVLYGIHPDTGKPYRWFGGHPLTVPFNDLPSVRLSEVRGLLTGLGFRPKMKDGERFRLPAKVDAGGRHDALVRHGAQLVAQNCSEALVNVLLDRNRTHCVPPLPADEVIAIAEWCLSKDRNISTELDAGEDFARAFGSDHKFGRGVWWHWTGNRLERDADGAIDRAVKGYVRALEHKARAIHEAETKQAVFKRARSFQTAGKIAAIGRLAQSEPGCVVHPAKFDADPMVLNVANGLLDLRTGLLRYAQRTDLVTKLAPVTFDPSATCPTWERFLSETFADALDVVGFLQRALGYSLTGLVSEQSLFILWGAGRNGKSVLLEVVKSMLGDGEYALTAAPSVLLEQKGSSIPNDLAALAGARFVTASETERNQKFAASRMKSLTGDEAVTARFLNKEFFTFIPQLKLWLATNGLPQFDGADFAMVRRLRVIRFNNVVPESRVNPGLKGQLLAELPGILNWCLAGCRQWQAEGMKAPSVGAGHSGRICREDGPDRAVLGAALRGHRTLEGQGPPLHPMGRLFELVRDECPQDHREPSPVDRRC